MKRPIIGSRTAEGIQGIQGTVNSVYWQVRLRTMFRCWLCLYRPEEITSEKIRRPSFKALHKTSEKLKGDDVIGVNASTNDVITLYSTTLSERDLTNTPRVARLLGLRHTSIIHSVAFRRMIIRVFNPLEFTGNYSATSNCMKLVHCR